MRTLRFRKEAGARGNHLVRQAKRIQPRGRSGVKANADISGKCGNGLYGQPSRKARDTLPRQWELVSVSEWCWTRSQRNDGLCLSGSLYILYVDRVAVRLSDMHRGDACARRCLLSLVEEDKLAV